MINFIFTPDGSVVFSLTQGGNATNNGKLPDVIGNHMDLISDNKSSFIEALTLWFNRLEQNELGRIQVINDLRDQLNQSTLQQQLNEALETIRQRDALISELQGDIEERTTEDNRWSGLMSGWFTTSIGRRTRAIASIDRIDLLAGIILKSEILVREAFAVILQRMIDINEPWTQEELEEVQRLFVASGFTL
jgi:hypothetical protein